MRACWLKWVGWDWSISADYIWLIVSDANTGKRHEVTVRIRRNTTGGLGATWAIDKVEAPVE